MIQGKVQSESPNQDFRLSLPLDPLNVVVSTEPSPSPLPGQVAPTQSLHLPLSGLGSALTAKGFADFESIHSRRCGVVSSELPHGCG